MIVEDLNERMDELGLSGGEEVVVRITNSQKMQGAPTVYSADVCGSDQGELLELYIEAPELWQRGDGAKRLVEDERVLRAALDAWYYFVTGRPWDGKGGTGTLMRMRDALQAALDAGLETR